MKYQIRNRRTTALCATAVLSASAMVALVPAAVPANYAATANAQQANISQDIYKQNTFASAPVTAQGNLSDPATCQIKWNLQAVYSRQLSTVSDKPASNSGWIQNVMSGGPALGAGHASLQHFTLGQALVRWRVPISIDDQIANGKLVFHLDDEDYDQAAIQNLSAAQVEQSNGWETAPTATAPGRTWAERFGGAPAGYTPIQRTLPVTVDAAAKTLTVDIGSMPAKSTAMIAFSLPTAGGVLPDAASNNTAYGMRAELNGSSIASCQNPGYEPGEAVAGHPATLPQTGDTDLPAGTRFALPSDYSAPAGWQVDVDAITGAVTTTPPAEAVPGDSIEVPVVVTYPDATTDTVTATVTVSEDLENDDGGSGSLGSDSLGSLGSDSLGSGSLGGGSLGDGSAGDGSSDAGSLSNLGAGSLGSLALGLGSLGLIPGLFTGSVGNGSSSNGSSVPGSTGNGSEGNGSTGNGSTGNGSPGNGSTGTGSDTPGSTETGSLDNLGLGSLSSLGLGLGSLGQLPDMLAGSLGNGSSGTGSLPGGSASAAGSHVSVGSSTNSAVSSTAGPSSALALGLGSLALGGLAFGGLVHALNSGVITLPAGVSVPPQLAWMFPFLANDNGE
ncbi:YPDG domain-containing protein [Dietzia timorensis]|nr:YPDG domain-containing protein [Dietzia timorensis]